MEAGVAFIYEIADCYKHFIHLHKENYPENVGLSHDIVRLYVENKRLSLAHKIIKMNSCGP